MITQLSQQPIARPAPPWRGSPAMRAACEGVLRRLGWPAQGPDGVRTLGLTSCHSGEGVTTLAAHLALTAAAQEAGPVLLVDANVAQPGLRASAACNRRRVWRSAFAPKSGFPPRFNPRWRPIFGCWPAASRRAVPRASTTPPAWSRSSRSWPMITNWSSSTCRRQAKPVAWPIWPDCWTACFWSSKRSGSARTPRNGCATCSSALGAAGRRRVEQASQPRASLGLSR